MKTKKVKNPERTDPLFDGHLEMDIKKMSPKEKLLYLSRQIQLRYFINSKVKKIPKSVIQK